MSEREKLKTIVQNFYNKTLEKDGNDYMCFAANYPLSEHLRNNKIETKLANGYVNGKVHYWLKYEDVIIDLTPNQEQFNHTIPLDEPYIFTKHSSFDSEDEQDFEPVFKLWNEPLLDFIYGVQSNEYIPPDTKQIEFLTRMMPTYLKYSVKAAIVLLNDIEQNNDGYLDFIYTACYGYTIEKIETLFDNLPDDWDKFIEAFKQWKIINCLQ